MRDLVEMEDLPPPPVTPGDPTITLTPKAVEMGKKQLAEAGEPSLGLRLG